MSTYYLNQLVKGRLDYSKLETVKANIFLYSVGLKTPVEKNGFQRRHRRDRDTDQYQHSVTDINYLVNMAVGTNALSTDFEKKSSLTGRLWHIWLMA